MGKTEVVSPYIDVKACAAFCNSTPGNIYQWVHEKKIPYVKLHKKLLFRISDLEEWIRDRNPAKGPHSPLSKFEEVRQRVLATRKE